MKILHLSSGPSSREYNQMQKMVKDDNLNSSYGMPEASYKFNKLIIEGFKENDADVYAVVGRSVSHRTHRGLMWKKNKHIENGIKYNHLFFINLPILKQLCIVIGAFICILIWLLKNKKEEKMIVVDGAYVSLIPIVNLFCNVNKICIVCDVYSYMANVMDAREKMSFKNKIINKLMQSQYQKMDGFVFLTDEMSKLDAFKNKPYVVIEGLVDTAIKEKTKLDKYIMYAGALRKEYGLERLVKAFHEIKSKNINLLLFGNGDYVDEIKKESKKDPRIKYMGKKSLDEIYEYERNATLLINPRFAESEFTKYSFPSKNLEYMLSGTPVLTGKLPGMPKEYNDYVYLIQDDSTNSLKESIESILKKSSKELKEFGKKAQSFVAKFKNKVVQAKKIIDFSSKLNTKHSKYMFYGIVLSFVCLLFTQVQIKLSLGSRNIYVYLFELFFIIVLLGHIINCLIHKIKLNLFDRKNLFVFLLLAWFIVLLIYRYFVCHDITGSLIIFRVLFLPILLVWYLKRKNIPMESVLIGIVLYTFYVNILQIYELFFKDYSFRQSNVLMNINIYLCYVISLLPLMFFAWKRFTNRKIIQLIIIINIFVTTIFSSFAGSRLAFLACPLSLTLSYFINNSFNLKQIFKYCIMITCIIVSIIVLYKFNLYDCKENMNRSLNPVLNVVGLKLENDTTPEENIINVNSDGESEQNNSTLPPEENMTESEVNVVDSNNMRQLLWNKSIEYVKSNPIFGKPSNDIVIEMKFHDYDNVVTISQSPHNFILETWLALGLPGLILYFMIVFGMVLNVIKTKLSKRDKCNALLVMILILGFSSFQPLVTSYFVISILFFLNIYMYSEEPL